MAFTQVSRLKSASDRALDLIQRDYPNYHPLIALAQMAHQENVRCDPRIEMEVHKAILPYVVPKLQTSEVVAEINEDRRIVVSLFEEHTLENGRTVNVEVPLITEVSEIVPLD
jgi:hypothetical protein